MHRFLVLAAVMSSLVVLPQLAVAGKPAGSAPAASCSVSGNIVSAAGLPTDQVINFMISDGSGTWGWVLGYTRDGTWSNGSKYSVFASCS